MNTDKDDDLEKRAQKHAKAMLEEIQTPTKSTVEDLTSILNEVAGTSLEPMPQSIVLKTPRKKIKGSSITPRKSGNKSSPTSVLKAGKHVSKTSERMETETPHDAARCGEQEDSSGYSDVSDTEEGELDKTLNRKAKNINLSKRNVKSIIHHLLTNEHVIKLYKDVLGAQDADNTPGSPVKSNSMGTLDSFPKMTRSKVKDFMEKSNIPPSPCKKQNSGPSILEVDFAEEEDDDEYSPEKDEINETDDDESVVSSYLSEFGSPCPVTPSTPVPNVCLEKLALTMSPSITGSPFASASKRLKIDLSGCEGLSEAEDEGTIALRTRSKRSLMDTSLLDIEQAFVAPDITPDMYDTCYQDKDWADFLNSLYKTNADESTVDDEVNDPEFNYIAEVEEEAFDHEDFRFDKPTKVSKKELNSLIEELHHLFEDEVLPLQVVAEASSTQDPISQLVSSNLRENSSTVQVSRSQELLPVPIQKSQVFSTQDSHLFPPSSFQSPQTSLPMDNDQFVVMPSCSRFDNSVGPDSSFKVPDLPTHAQTRSTCGQKLSGEAQVFHQPQNSVMQHHEKMLIEDNIRKHIQLLTQTFLLSKAGNDKSKDKISNVAKEMLLDLNSRKLVNGSDSVMNVCNLEKAVQVVSDGSYTYHEGNLEECKVTIFNSPVFMYPHLLPKLETIPNRKKTSSKPRCKFLSSEDNLIALGLEQFTGCTGAFPSEFIHQHLVRAKSVNEIYRRIMYLSSTQAGINHVKKLRKLGQRVQLDPPSIHPIDFHPPRHKSFDVLPEWCRELRNREASLNNESSTSFVIFTQESTTAFINKHNNELSGGSNFLAIQPKPGRSHSQTNQNSVNHSSSVISHRRKRVYNKTYSNSGNFQNRRGKKRGTISSDAQLSPPSVGFESATSVTSPLRLNGNNIEFSQSPDLLRKAMASCGIDGLPSPTSSSTPLPTDKQKPSSVKNLASAFDESEMIRGKNNEQMQQADTDNVDSSESCVLNQDQIAPPVSKVPPDIAGGCNVNSVDNSKSDCASHSLVGNESSVSSHVPGKMDSKDDSERNSKTLKDSCDSTLSEFPMGDTCVNEGEVGENNSEGIKSLDSEESGGASKANVVKQNVIQLSVTKKSFTMDKSGVSETVSGERTKGNIDKESDKTSIINAGPAKHNVIQLTVIKKPSFENNSQGALKTTKDTNEHSGKEKDSFSSSYVVCVQEDRATPVTNEKLIAKDVTVVEKRANHSIPTSDHPGSSHDPTRVKKDESGEGGSSTNKLVPWISSIISQFETQDSVPVPGNKKISSESFESSDSSSNAKQSSTPPGADLSDIPIEMFRSPESSPLKMIVFSTSSPKRTPTKLHPIAPKTSPCIKSAQYVPLPRVSPKRKELNRQVRNILPKSFVFETKLPSPTKTTALSLKKRATLLCQKSPVKILTRPANVPASDIDVGMSTRGRSTMLTRSQRGISKPKRREEPTQKIMKRVKKTEEEYESAKETESEASEIEESGLSQEEDEDRTKLDDLMAASTTIRCGSRQPTSIDDDVKTKAEKKKAMSLSLLRPDLVQNDPKKDDRDTAFAQKYFNRVKETLSSDPERFYKFLSLLKDLNKDHTSPVELYLDVVSLLSDHQQLVEDFAGFLLSFQAVECQCFSTNFQYSQIRQFLRQVEVHCGSSTATYRKVLKALSTWSIMCQEGKLEGGLRVKMLGILKNVPGVLDNLISYFLDGAVSECHKMDFEDVCLDEEDDQMIEGDGFENVVLPDEPEDYNTKTCTCECHSSNTQDERYQRRMKHCISCSLQVYDGQPVLKMSRYEFRPVSIVYPSEEEDKEKEDVSQAMIETQQVYIAQAEEQEQQIGKKRKGDFDLKGSSPKKIRKQYEKHGEECSSDSNEDYSAESGSELTGREIAEGKTKLKRDKITGGTTQITKQSIDKLMKTYKEKTSDCVDREDNKSVKPRKGRITNKINKLNSKSDDLHVNQGDEVCRSDKTRKDSPSHKKENESLKIDQPEDSGQADKSSNNTVVHRDEKVKSKFKTKTYVSSKGGNKESQEIVNTKAGNEIELVKAVVEQSTKESDIHKSDKLLPKSSDSCQGQENESNTEKKDGTLNKDDKPAKNDFSKKRLKSKVPGPKGSGKKVTSRKTDLRAKGNTVDKGKCKTSQGTVNAKEDHKEETVKDGKTTKDSPVDKSGKSLSKATASSQDQDNEGNKDNFTISSEEKEKTLNKLDKPAKRVIKSKQMKSQSKVAGTTGNNKKAASRKIDASVQGTNKAKKSESIGPDGDFKVRAIPGKLNKQSKVNSKDKNDTSHSNVVSLCEDKSVKQNPSGRIDDKFNTSPSDQRISKQSKDKTVQSEEKQKPLLETDGKEKEDDCKTSNEPSSDTHGSQALSTNITNEENMEVDDETETTSETFDRCILDNISDEGLTEAALKNIHGMFPLKSVQVIRDRAQQLLSLLESMSDDESTDMEEGNKML